MPGLDPGIQNLDRRIKSGDDRQLLRWRETSHMGCKENLQPTAVRPRTAACQSIGNTCPFRVFAALAHPLH